MRSFHSLSIAIAAIVVAACTGAGSASPAATGSSGAPSAEPVPMPLAVGHVVECGRNDRTCDVHLTKDDVQDPPGWPVTIDGPCREFRTGETGLAVVGCDASAGAMIHVIGLDGRPIDGWPVGVDGTITSVTWNDFSIGCGIERSAIEVGSDGSVYVAIATGPVANLHVFDPDGDPRVGWPQPIPGDGPGGANLGGEGCQGFTLADDDGVVAWGYQGVDPGLQPSADRTEFTSWSANGQVRPGWLLSSEGAASGPVLDLDGGVTYVSASGSVWSHDDAGEIRPGWPYLLGEPAPPHIAPDGRVAIVVRAGDGRDRLILLRRDGGLVTGGPIMLPAEIERRCPLGTTPCDGVTSPAFASDGTVYLSLASSTAESVITETTKMGGALVAFDADGAVIDGWPIDLAAQTRVVELTVDVDDRLVARGYVCHDGFCGGAATVPTTITFAPDGELIDQTFGD